RCRSLRLPSAGAVEQRGTGGRAHDRSGRDGPAAGQQVGLFEHGRVLEQVGGLDVTVPQRVQLVEQEDQQQRVTAGLEERHVERYRRHVEHLLPDAPDLADDLRFHVDYHEFSFLTAALGSATRSVAPALSPDSRPSTVAASNRSVAYASVRRSASGRSVATSSSSYLRCSGSGSRSRTVTSGPKSGTAGGASSAATYTGVTAGRLRSRSGWTAAATASNGTPAARYDAIELSRTRPSSSRQDGSPRRSTRSTSVLTNIPTACAASPVSRPSHGNANRKSRWVPVRASTAPNSAAAVMNVVTPRSFAVARSWAVRRSSSVSDPVPASVVCTRPRGRSRGSSTSVGASASRATTDSLEPNGSAGRTAAGCTAGGSSTGTPAARERYAVAIWSSSSACPQPSMTMWCTDSTSSAPVPVVRISARAGASRARSNGVQQAAASRSGSASTTCTGGGDPSVV